MTEKDKWYRTTDVRIANDHGQKKLQQKWERALVEHPESADDWEAEWRDVPEVIVGS